MKHLRFFTLALAATIGLAFALSAPALAQTKLKMVLNVASMVPHSPAMAPTNRARRGRSSRTFGGCLVPSPDLMIGCGMQARFHCGGIGEGGTAIVGASLHKGRDARELCYFDCANTSSFQMMGAGGLC